MLTMVRVAWLGLFPSCYPFRKPKRTFFFLFTLYFFFFVWKYSFPFIPLLHHFHIYFTSVPLFLYKDLWLHTSDVTASGNKPSYLSVKLPVGCGNWLYIDYPCIGWVFFASSFILLWIIIVSFTLSQTPGSQHASIFKIIVDIFYIVGFFPFEKDTMTLKG